jgi:CRP-like cAMP-binding protein
MATDLIEKFGVTYPENTVIFREGDAGDEMYIIQTGEVIISKKSQKNTQLILAVLKNGDFFGEMSLFTTEKRSATAISKNKSLILKIDKTSFEFMLANNLAFAQKMITRLCERLHRADEQIAELITISPDVRMLQYLMDYWKIAGQQSKAHDVLVFPYDDFIIYLTEKEKLSKNDANKNLLRLKEKSLLNLKKDTQGKIYVSFSPQVFKYFNII